MSTVRSVSLSCVVLDAGVSGHCGHRPGQTRQASQHIETAGDWQYLAAILDPHSRQVVGLTIAMVQLRSDARTREYVVRRTGEGLSKKEINRCLKRYIVRELYLLILADLADATRPG